MKRLLKYIISLLIVLLPLYGTAQDSLEVAQSKLVLGISADYGKGLESLYNKQTKWEIGLGFLVFQQFNFKAEYGFANLNPENVIINGSYNAKGNYYRLGLEYVIAVVPKTYLSTGIMYAHADFSDTGEISIASDLWTDLDQTINHNGLSATWYEWIINTEAPLIKAQKGFFSNHFFSNFYWGLRLRLRFLASEITQPDINIFAIPGFGKTFNRTVPAANFFVKYNISF